jgi:hypothetical protein
MISESPSVAQDAEQYLSEIQRYAKTRDQDVAPMLSGFVRLLSKFQTYRVHAPNDQGLVKALTELCLSARVEFEELHAEATGEDLDESEDDEEDDENDEYDEDEDDEMSCVDDAADDIKSQIYKSWPNKSKRFKIIHYESTDTDSRKIANLYAHAQVLGSYWEDYGARLTATNIRFTADVLQYMFRGFLKLDT